MLTSSDVGPSNPPDSSNRGKRPQRVDTDQEDQILSPQELDLEVVWTKRNLLSLGGGVRGYWTLLVLKRLMQAIGDEERQQAHKAHSNQTRFHSFWPQEFPANVTQGPFEKEEMDQQRQAQENLQDVCHGLRDERKFLPCHYFDYICGSSTGSLIAIMLGRFRMTVQDCLNEYEKMSHKIFGSPRLISQRNIGIVPWPKYNSSAMEKAFKEVTNRRSEKHPQFQSVMFPSIAGICNTFVTTMVYTRTKGSEGSSQKTYLIRSYDHYEKKDPPPPIIKTATGTSNRYLTTNYGLAENLEIWQVARAATAAPMYFTEVEKQSNDGNTRMYFSDGGFGHTNNPTQLGINEIETLHGKGNIGIVLSVGTARANGKSGGKSIFKRVKGFADTATDPKIVEEHLQGRDLYWRLNDSQGINVELDEWKPNSLFTKSPGKKTLTTIQREFWRWSADKNNINLLEECARELVRRRRKRSEDGSRWERYATGAQFRCMHGECGAQTFNSRKMYEHHCEHDLNHSKEGKGHIDEPKITTWQYQDSSRP